MSEEVGTKIDYVDIVRLYPTVEAAFNAFAKAIDCHPQIAGKVFRKITKSGPPRPYGTDRTTMSLEITVDVAYYP